MIHTGGAFGGHYFAYIKSFEDGKWYNFNDSSVTELENDEELFKTFGGQQSSNTAYMLMYRKVRKGQTTVKFPDDLVPEYISQEIEKETQDLIVKERAAEEKLLSLNLKVYHEGQPKDISVKKTDTLEDLIQRAYQDFGIEGKEVQDCRLRLYDAIMKVRLDVYNQYDKQLIELSKFYSRSTLDLEFKDEQGNFEEFDPNWLYLRAIKWEEGMSYDFSRPEQIPTQLIKIDPLKEKVSELEQRLSECLDIPVENLIIILRKESGYSSKITADYYNMDWRREKLIKECSKFEHGQILFCEFGIHGNKEYENYNWKQEFKAESEKITISINDAVNDPEGLEFRIKISIACSQTVQQLKQQIANRFSLDLNDFYLVKNINDKEIKEMNKSLALVGIQDHAMIKVVLGKPQLDGGY